MRAVEAALYGLMLGLVGALTTTGLVTLASPHPSAVLQYIQIVHHQVGLVSLPVGGLYLVVHVLEALRRLRLPRPPLVRRSAIAFALAAAAMVALSARLSGTIHQLGSAVLGVAGLSFLVLTSRAIGRTVLRPRSTSTGASGAVAALTLVLVGGTGFLIPTGSRPLPRLGVDAIWAMHVGAALALFTVVLHAAQARARRRAAGERARFPWRVPLALAAASTLMVAVLTVRYVNRALRHAAALPRAPSAVGLVPEDPGFSELAEHGCDACHATVIETWRESSHALAARNPLFTGLVRSYYAEGKRETVRFCVRCHAPHAPDPVTTDVDRLLESEGYGAGVHCGSCHRAVPHVGRGDGQLAVRRASEDPFRALAVPMIGDQADPDWARRTTRLLYSSRLRAHLRQLERPPPAVSCGPCHHQSLLVPTGGRLTTVLQDQIGSWERSPAGAAGLECASCHVRHFASTDGYVVPDHHFAAASTYLAGLARGEPGVRAVVASLEGRPLPMQGALFARQFPEPPAPLLELELAAATGQIIVQTRNTQRIGHAFPEAPTDIVEVWLAVRAVDASGSIVLDLGGDGPPGAARLGHELHDARGEPVVGHRLWEVASVVDRGRVPSQGALSIDVALPPATSWPVEVEVSWRYRRLDPALVQAVTGVDASAWLPAVTIASTREKLDSPTDSVKPPVTMGSVSAP